VARRDKSDKVFSLSLTEISLLLVFVVLALYGASIYDIEKKLQFVEDERDELQKFKVDTEEVLSQLGVSLDELRKTASRLISEDLLNQSEKNIQEAIDNYIKKIKELMELREENLTLRSDRDELVGRVKALEKDGVPGGTEPGSCWFGGDEKEEYFLDVELLDDGFRLTPAWPERRQDDLEEFLISSDEIPRGIVTRRELKAFAHPIYKATTQKECRFFVRLTDHTTEKFEYKQQKSLVESYFFIYEPRSSW